MTNYYVDSDVAGPGSGTIGDPWDDINTNLSNLVAGDTMYLRGGANKAAAQSYTEQLTITSANGCANGSAGNPITIANYPDEYVTFSYSTYVDGFTISRSYWTIDGTGTDGSGDYYFEIDMGTYSGKRAIRTQSGGDNFTLSYIEIHGAKYHMVEIDDCDNVVIEYCLIYDTFAGAYTDAHGVIVSGYSDDGIIRYCEIYDCRGDCIEVFRDYDTEAKANWEVYGCDLYTSVSAQGSTELAIGFKGGESWQVHDNTIHGFRDCDGSTGGSGADGQGIVLGTGGVSSVFYDNEIYDISGAAIRIDRDNVVFRHNLIRDLVDEASIGEQSILYVTGGAQGADLHNNTIVGSYEGQGNYIRVLSGGEADFQNNIVYDGNTVQNDGTLTYDYNDCYSCTDSLAGANGITDDPLFVDAASDDYNLTASSPCIDAGDDLGYNYNGSAPDLGAFETGGAITPAPATAVVGVVDPQVGSAGWEITPAPATAVVGVVDPTVTGQPPISRSGYIVLTGQVVVS